MRPDKLAQGRRALHPLGRLTGARGPRPTRSPCPTGTRSSTRPAALTWERDAPALQRAGARPPRRGRRAGRWGRDHVPQPPLLHRGDDGLREARRGRALPQHRLRRAAARGRDGAREAHGADLRPGVHRSALRRCQGWLRRFVAWEEKSRGRRDDGRAADLGCPRRGPRAALRAGPLHHPHLRHHRHAEGRAAQRARGPERPRGAVLEDPAPLRGDGDDRRAPLPLLGLPALHAQPADRRDDGPAAEASTRRTRCGRSPSTGPGSSPSSR